MMLVTPAVHFTQRSLITPTSCGAEVDQQQLLSGAKLVGHGADHLPPRRRHGHPDSCVRVIAAVDLQKDCGNADRGQGSGQEVFHAEEEHIYLLSS